MSEKALLLIVIDACANDYESWHQILWNVRDAERFLCENRIAHGDSEVANAIQEAMEMDYLEAYRYNDSHNAYDKITCEIVTPVPQDIYPDIWYFVTEKGRALVDSVPDSIWRDMFGPIDTSEQD